MAEEQQLQQEVAAYTDVALVADSMDAFRQNLAGYINALISTDFNKLVFILYRLDISEKKLKQLLATKANTDAGVLIAAMIIERQLQKIALRRQYKMDDSSIAEDDKW